MEPYNFGVTARLEIEHIIMLNFVWFRMELGVFCGGYPAVLILKISFY